MNTTRKFSIVIISVLALILPILSILSSSIPLISSVKAEFNLIQNASLEFPDPANSSIPLGWNKGVVWGTEIPTYTYPVNDAPVSDVSSGIAAKISYSSYTAITPAIGGDAKWYFAPVPVTPGRQYKFNDAYVSDVHTQIIAEFFDTNHVHLSFGGYINVPATPDSVWKISNDEITVPTGAAYMTVFHSIFSVGTLIVDNFSLVELPPAPNPNVVVNPSLEISAVNGNPADWLSGSWGVNNPIFTYPVAGMNGGKATRVEMTSYTTGDAKWYPNVIPVTPGDSYNFSDWYQSNVVTEPVIDFTYNDGTHYYLGLRSAPVAANWTQYMESFQVPANAKTMTALHLIKKVGSLTVDDYSLIKFTPKGFTRPLVTITFDNGFEDNITTTMPLFDQYKFKVTYCFSTEYLEGQPAQIAIAKAIAAKGHEICSHSTHHSLNMTTLSPASLSYEVNHAQAYLQTLTGQSIRNFFTPFGAYNDDVVNAIKKVHRAHRPTDEGFNTQENFDIYRLTVQNMLSTTTLAQFQSWVDQAIKDKSWLILVYHRVTPTGFGIWDTPKADFKPQMDVLKNAPITLETMDQALDELLPQLSGSLTPISTPLPTPTPTPTPSVIPTPAPVPTSSPQASPLTTPTISPSPSPDPSDTSTITPTPTITGAEDTIAPVVLDFNIKSRFNNGVFVINFTVSDQGGSYLKKVNLMRAKYVVDLCDENTKDGCDWSSVMRKFAPDNSNQWSDIMINKINRGTYWYGLHVSDKAGNVGFELNAIKISREMNHRLPLSREKAYF